MRISISRPALQQAVTQASRAVSGRAPMPALSGLLLRADDDGLTITGYDLELAIETRIPATIEEQGVMVVPAKQFGGIVKALGHSEVVMSRQDNGLKIQADRARFTLQAMNAAEYPALPAAEGQFVILPHEEFRRCARKVSYAAEQVSGSRYAVVNTIIADGELTMVATDTFRLAARKTAAPHCEPIQVLLPVGFVAEIERLDGAVHLHLSDRHVQIQSGETRVISRLIEGQWPDWRQVIPSESSVTTWVTVDRAALAGALQRVSLMCKDDLAAVDVRIDPDTKDDLIITATHAEVGEAREEMNVFCDGECSMDVAIRPKYLRDALAVMGGENAQIGYCGPKRPVMVRDESDEGWTYVVMPVMRPS